ncbi:DUF6869 domain-containing protein [Lysobacter changpingensis]|uniref:DUF6869 domain-containing protein n=1 Tax=Lysobacter changpingensis TaxID=2792784 RepID=UPI003CCD0688
MPERQGPVNEVAAAYIAALASGDEDAQARSIPIDYWLDSRWDDIWLLLQAISELPGEIDNLTLATVAAGPLEDLLSKAPASYADQVLTAAYRSPRMARMLTGVWRSSIAPETWERVVEFCRKVPEPIDGTYRYRSGQVCQNRPR